MPGRMGSTPCLQPDGNDGNVMLRILFSQSVVGEQCLFHPSIVCNVLPLQSFIKLTTLTLTIFTCELIPFTLRVSPSTSTV